MLRHHYSLSHQLKSIFGDILKKLSALPYHLLLFIIVIMPLVYNEGEAWWLPLASLILTFAFITWALPLWWHGRLVATLRFSPALLLFLIPFVISLVQLIPNLPCLSILSPTVAEWWQKFNEIALIPGIPRLTIAPDATTERALLFGLTALFFFLLTNCVTTTGRLQGLLLGIAGAALCNALLAYVQICLPETGHPASALRGAFLNRNHFAFLMLLGTMASLSLLAMINHHYHRHQERSHSFPWQRLSIPLVLVIFTLLTAQVISLSRGAFIASSIAIILFAAFWFASPHSHHHVKRQKILAGTVLFVLALSFALYFSLAKLSQRYADLTKKDFTMDDRWLIWKDTLNLIADNWQLGVGQGAYPYAIEMYESGHITHFLVGHAHNDFLEFIAETGIPVSMLLGMLGFILFAFALRRAWRLHGRPQRWAGLGTLIAIVAALIHEMVEFNLQAWANMFIFTAIIAAAAMAVSKKPKPHDTLTASTVLQTHLLRKAHRRKRLTSRLPWLLLSIGALLLIPTQIRYLESATAYTTLNRDLTLGYRTSKPNHMDFTRRTKLLKKAFHPLLNQHYLLKQNALLHAVLAETSNVKLQSKLLDEAADMMAQAARHMPTNGDTAIQNAIFHYNANLFGTTKLPPPHLEQLYNWAVMCQPNMVPTLEKVGMRAFQDFLDAYGQDDSRILEHHKQRARKILLHALKLCPDSEQIFNALFYLYGNTPELMAVAPKNYGTMSTLAGILIEKRQPLSALTLAQHILNQQNYKLTHEQKIDTYSIIASTQAVLNLHEERKDSWKKLWQEVRNYIPDEDFSEQDNQNPRQVLLELEKQEERTFASSFDQVRKATVLSLLGRQTDTVIALLPLTYQFYTPASPKLIRQALNLLGSSTHSTNPFFMVQESFLKYALQIILAEQTGILDNLPDAIHALESLSKDVETQEHPWLNRHLIPLYAAKGHRLLKQNQLAVKAFRQSLAICPNNYIALGYLKELAPETLKKAEIELLNTLGTNHLPIAQFSSGLTWFNVSFSQKRILHKHQKQIVSYVFACHNDILHPIDLKMIYKDREGSIFDDKIVFKDGEEMTFRIGEVIQIEHVWQPYVKTLTQSARLIIDGDITVKASDKALPTPYTWAFQVKLSTD